MSDKAADASTAVWEWVAGADDDDEGQAHMWDWLPF
ncbi:hypothetical protein HDA32_000626 [Spinactinospora alkalitolerans]|uniref:Uncharacterized protein n=1 Tax=Spinactinospora alkalitolerans TaxID=687207 RepID=A0A852TMI7_9ACTN|nr:hypothetical protein [Spinactinospora alkalitolerans]